ncbi:hypothetical protein VOLCADRAFT_93843 [Volvox carteri f. nagariensis]|uniref:P/Homo B domain-containing protein n=1 Tax=Volvox carteri f. nagariensis TaxID=3068 RepID=D8U376_VOLCA|nr:uncharacterized protein VOLCADRAFT_93843 [Volvox carteri f. nagariensis]EFJ45777.1 hypothetical protein VOLCADRAFT_93843 [Volvox carteri f. nagariensis]|eukprot:XP_002953178.1 hypothetical protein VOLCADRAFT_93843 [Volvox carteri f. nagariensis]
MKARTILCTILMMAMVGAVRTQQMPHQVETASSQAGVVAPDAAAAAAANPSAVGAVPTAVNFATAAAPAAAAAGIPTAPAPASCLSYCKLDSTVVPSSATAPVVSTLVVPDTFPVGSVAVADISLEHSRVGALKISLVALPLVASPASPPLVSAVLKDVRSGSSGANLVGTGFTDDGSAAPFPSDASSAPFTGTWRSAESMSAAFASLPSAAGSWSLRVADLGQGRANRTIQLTKWTLVLCPANAVNGSKTSEAGGPAAAAAVQQANYQQQQNGAAAEAAAAAGALTAPAISSCQSYTSINSTVVPTSAGPQAFTWTIAESAHSSAVLKDVRSGSSGANLVGTGFTDDGSAAPFPSDASSAPFTGTWRSAESMSAAFASLPSAAGSWSLRVADLGPGRANRTIQLTKWTLVLCPANAVNGSKTSEAGGPAAAAAVQQANYQQQQQNGAAAHAAAPGGSSSELRAAIVPETVLNGSIAATNSATNPAATNPAATNPAATNPAATNAAATNAAATNAAATNAAAAGAAATNAAAAGAAATNAAATNAAATNAAATNAAATGAAATNAAATNGAATNGAATNGAATNGAATNGAATNGAATNGAAINGAATNGAATNAAATNAAATNAAATGGAATNAAATSGATTNAAATNAAATNAAATNASDGVTTVIMTPEGSTAAAAPSTGTGDAAMIMAAVPNNGGATGPMRGGSNGLLEQLLKRINRVDIHSSAANTTVPADDDADGTNSTTDSAARAALDDEDVTLVQRLLNRLAELNATSTPRTASSRLNTTGSGGSNGTLGPAADAAVNATAAAANRAAMRSMWRLGNTALNDSDGLVSNFLSSLSDVLYSLSNTTVPPPAVDGSQSSATYPPSDPPAASVRSMAQSVLRTLLDGDPPLLGTMAQSGALQNGFRWDDIGKALDRMTGAATEMGGRAQLPPGTALRGFSAGHLPGLQQGPVAGVQVPAFLEAMQVAAEVMASRLNEGADRVETAMKALQSATKMASKQLEGLSLRNGSPAPALLGPLSSAALDAMKMTSKNLRDAGQNAFQLLLTGTRTRLDALGVVYQLLTGALYDTGTTINDIWVATISRGLGRLLNGLNAMLVKGGPGAKLMLQSNSRGLEMLQSSVNELRTKLDSAAFPPSSTSSPPSSGVGLWGQGKASKGAFTAAGGVGGNGVGSGMDDKAGRQNLQLRQVMDHVQNLRAKAGSRLLAALCKALAGAVPDAYMEEAVNKIYSFQGVIKLYAKFGQTPAIFNRIEEAARAFCNANGMAYGFWSQSDLLDQLNTDSNYAVHCRAADSAAAIRDDALIAGVDFNGVDALVNALSTFAAKHCDELDAAAELERTFSRQAQEELKQLRLERVREEAERGRTAGVVMSALYLGLGCMEWGDTGVRNDFSKGFSKGSLGVFLICNLMFWIGYATYSGGLCPLSLIGSHSKAPPGTMPLVKALSHSLAGPGQSPAGPYKIVHIGHVHPGALM